MQKVMIFFCYAFLVFFNFSLIGKTIVELQRESTLKIIENQSILHLRGTPYEMGFKQGEFLKKEITSNIQMIIDERVLSNQNHPQIKQFLDSMPHVLPFIPEEYIQEMKGLADGAQLPYEKVLLLNLLPEMFHCSGITVGGEATEKGELYHVRVLDYNFGRHLQKTAVLMVVEPDGKIPFVNVSYAGFIGSVTGMNSNHIALGEIGGKGYGDYLGLPMSFLMRRILENASSLEDVKKILNNSPRTCEYFYVFSDGKKKESIGVYATAQQLKYIEPGTSYALFDPSLSNSDGPFQPLKDKEIFADKQLIISPYQTLLYQDEQQKIQQGLVHRQPKDCLILTGFSNPQRYPILVERLVQNYGKINVEDLKRCIKQPVSMASNLHNALFIPSKLDLWISHAGPNDEPASDQPYHYFNLKELLSE